MVSDFHYDSMKGWLVGVLAAAEGAPRTKRKLEKLEPGDNVSAEGRISDIITTGSYSQSIVLDGYEQTRILMDAEKYQHIKPWLTVKGVRKLLAVGVSVRVHGAVSVDDQTTLIANRMVIAGALPSAPYLARLLSFPLDTFRQLFGNESADATFLDLACALRPYSAKEVEKLCAMCQKEKQDGRFPLLFKHPKLLELSESIREHQGWHRGPQKIPATTAETWAALLRMEAAWCQPCGGTADTEVPTVDEPKKLNQRLVFNDIDVDPDVPFQDDPQRLKYINERKRPQIRWMLGLIGKLLEEKERPYRLIDVGGGRGDLSNAVAAHFGEDVHLTVLDINKSSLEAGKNRAESAGLGSTMNFRLCDLGDEEQVSDLLSQTPDLNIDLVFGLHCCGGLAEAAVELAMRASASFCVSTCCFRSHDGLASLSRLAGPQRSDWDLLKTLAVTGRADGQHRAIRALNSMRLAAANKRFEQLHGCLNSSIHVWQEFLPMQYSEQNAVMVGSIK